jgi:hypothetical protein
MKVIFLDVDGVLVTDRSVKRQHDYLVQEGYIQKFTDAQGEIRYKQVLDIPRNMLSGFSFNQTSLFLLKKIVDNTGASIVVSSSWRNYPDEYNILLHTLSKYGMQVIDKTAKKRMSSVRGREITQWLRQHTDVTEYVILDDTLSCFIGYDELRKHLVLTSTESGLISKTCAAAIKILGG